MICITDACREGRDKCPTPNVCGAERTRRVQESDLRWSREIGYEAGQPHLNRTQPAPARKQRSDPWGWIPDRPGRAVLIYAGTVLASALAAAAWFINT